MKALQSYLDKLGSNFIVASMIPSLAFFTISMLVFKPILPDAIFNYLGGEFDPLGKSGLLLFLATVILGFTLTSLNTFIYKLFEGYVLLWHFPFFKRNELARARKIQRQKRCLERKIDRLVNPSSQRAENKRDELFARKQALAIDYNIMFPDSDDDIMPTRFGNTLKAAEAYSRSRYNIDAVPVWPRFIHVIPESYFSKVNQSSNELSFLMNFTFLTICFSLVTLMAALYQYFLVFRIANENSESLLYFIPVVQEDIQKYSQRAGIYFVLFFAALLVSWVFLKASNLVVIEYGYLIRSAFDLFRFDLLKQFRMEIPCSLDDELESWEDICDFLNLGNQDGHIKFDYHHFSEDANTVVQS